MKALTRIAATTAATLTLVGSTVAMTAAPASAATKVGSITTAEATKVWQQMLRQKCLTKKEIRKIVHGQGYYADGTLSYDGAKKSRLSWVDVDFESGCAYHITAWKK